MILKAALSKPICVTHHSMRNFMLISDMRTFVLIFWTINESWANFWSPTRAKKDLWHNLGFFIVMSTFPQMRGKLNWSGCKQSVWSVRRNLRLKGDAPLPWVNEGNKDDASSVLCIILQKRKKLVRSKILSFFLSKRLKYTTKGH